MDNKPEKKQQPGTRSGQSRQNNNPVEEVKGLEKVIKIDRITKVVKGGKRLGFRAFIIKGDFEGSVGLGLAKSKEVPVAIKKGVERASKKQFKINLVKGTIPHPVVGKFGSCKVIMKPARPGTGVIAGGPVRIMLEALGVKNVVAKVLGSGNAINTARAALNGLLKLKDYDRQVKLRGKSLPVRIVGEE